MGDVKKLAEEVLTESDRIDWFDDWRDTAEALARAVLKMRADLAEIRRLLTENDSDHWLTAGLAIEKIVEKYK